jgi:hypothetical protein
VVSTMSKRSCTLLSKQRNTVKDYRERTSRSSARNLMTRRFGTSKTKPLSLLRRTWTTYPCTTSLAKSLHELVWVELVLFKLKN